MLLELLELLGLAGQQLLRQPELVLEGSDGGGVGPLGPSSRQVLLRPGLKVLDGALPELRELLLLLPDLPRDPEELLVPARQPWRGAPRPSWTR